MTKINLFSLMMF